MWPAVLPVASFRSWPHLSDLVGTELWAPFPNTRQLLFQPSALPWGPRGSAARAQSRSKPRICGKSPHRFASSPSEAPSFLRFPPPQFQTAVEAPNSTLRVFSSVGLPISSWAPSQAQRGSALCCQRKHPFSANLPSVSPFLQGSYLHQRWFWLQNQTICLLSWALKHFVVNILFRVQNLS